MALNVLLVLSVGVLLLFTPGSRSCEDHSESCGAQIEIVLLVENDQDHWKPTSYFAPMLKGGVLLGALRRLQDKDCGFSFTATENPDYGWFLESVNGVAGDQVKGTYWQLLSKSSGEYIPLEVGVGCYMPKADEHIKLKFTTWKTEQ